MCCVYRIKKKKTTVDQTWIQESMPIRFVNYKSGRNESGFKRILDWKWKYRPESADEI